MTIAGMTPIVSGVPGSNWKRYEFREAGLTALIQFSDFYMKATWKVEGSKRKYSGTVAELTEWVRSFAPAVVNKPLPCGFSRISVKWTWNYLNVPGKCMVSSVKRVIDATGRTANDLRGKTEQEIINLMEVC